MTARMTLLEKRLCNALQTGLPVCARPFAAIARLLGGREQQVLDLTSRLKQSGIIRRIRAMLNYRALGRTGTLVAAHIEPDALKEAAEAVNALDTVSHNYLRSHYYNLWFTLQADSDTEIDTILESLAGELGIDFHSLPVVRVFKLDVRFDAESEGRAMLQDVEAVPSVEPVKLSRQEKSVLSGLAGELQITARPFAFLAVGGHSHTDVLKVIKRLVEKGVIRRIAAVIDHRRLGFTANVMLAAEVPAGRIEQAGRHLARFSTVSHCYERRTFPGWQYNLFAMMHARSMGRIQHDVQRFVNAEKIHAFELLPTEAELKKHPVPHKLA